MFDSWAPVVFDTNFNIIYPSIENDYDNRDIILPIGKTIILSCKGGHFNGISSTKTLMATCNQDSKFEAQDQIIDVETLECVNFRIIDAKNTNLQCSSTAGIIQVGFSIGLNINFIPLINYCFDIEALNTAYAHYNLSKHIGFIKSYLQDVYVLDTVYDNININFTILYNFTNQQILINNLLGLPETSTKYLNPETCHPVPSGVGTTPGFCITQRNLVFRGDFVYINQQEAIFRYINIVPQWYFLDYNLEKLEWDVINYVKLNKIDLEIYSGTYGIATLPHEKTGEEIQIHLLVDGNNTNKVPLPQIFWKLVYEPIKKEAVVFFTVNNPFAIDKDRDILCEDISDNFSWLTWEKHNVTKGYSYACEYDGVKAKIPFLPTIDVLRVLE